MHELQLGLQLMLYGLGGVFLSLVVFYVIIRALNSLAKRSNNKAAQKSEQ